MVQYVVFMLIFNVLFIAISIILIPFAYFVGIMDKIKTMSQQKDPKQKLMNNLLFIPFGLVILFFDIIAFYF